MEVFCPKCGTGTEVGVSAASAACAACGAPLPLHMPAFGPPQAAPRPQAFGVEDMAAVPRVVPPRVNFNWREQQLAGGAWGVSVRQGAPVGCWVLAIMAFTCVVIGSVIWGSESAEIEPLAPVIVLGIVGAIFGYKSLCLAVNRGTLRLDQNWLAMSRGPLPEKISVRAPTASIATFRPLKAMTVKSGATRTTYWAIQVIGADGSLWRLPLGNLPRDQADYVCERLTAILRDVQKRCGIVPPQLPPQYQQGF
jgi:hypothetical protein